MKPSSSLVSKRIGQGEGNSGLDSIVWFYACDKLFSLIYCQDVVSQHAIKLTCNDDFTIHVRYVDIESM